MKLIDSRYICILTCLVSLFVCSNWKRARAGIIRFSMFASWPNDLCVRGASPFQYMCSVCTVHCAHSVCMRARQSHCVRYGLCSLPFHFLFLYYFISLNVPVSDHSLNQSATTKTTIKFKHIHTHEYTEDVESHLTKTFHNVFFPTISLHMRLHASIYICRETQARSLACVCMLKTTSSINILLRR